MAAKTQPARGMRDFLPADVRRREYVIRIIKDVYERYGFEPLETPAVENIETLLGKYGEEGNQLIFKILKRGEHERTGEADLALRYDLTVPLARVVAAFKHVAELPSEKLGARRTVLLTGISASAQQMWDAVKAKASGKVRFEPDPALQAITDAVPKATVSQCAAELGLPHSSSIEEIVREYQATALAHHG